MVKSKKKYQKPYKEITHPDERFTQISRGYLRGHAFGQLTDGSRVLLFLLRTGYNGHNNGSITLSIREAAEMLGRSTSTIRDAFKQLADIGFITAIKKGYLGSDGKGIATSWELADFGVDGKIPTYKYKKYNKPAFALKMKTKAGNSNKKSVDKNHNKNQNPWRNSLQGVAESTPLNGKSVAESTTGVVEITTSIAQKRVIPVVESATYIDNIPHPTSLNINPNNLSTNFCDQNDHTDLANKLGSNGWDLLLKLPDDQINILVEQNNTGKLTKQVIANVHFLYSEKGGVH